MVGGAPGWPRWPCLQHNATGNNKLIQKVTKEKKNPFSIYFQSRAVMECEDSKLVLSKTMAGCHSKLLPIGCQAIPFLFFLNRRAVWNRETFTRGNARVELNPLSRASGDTRVLPWQVIKDKRRQFFFHFIDVTYLLLFCKLCTMSDKKASDTIHFKALEPQNKCDWCKMK